MSCCPGRTFKRSQLLSMLRELMEWAALLKLASQPPVKLLIRDGLLRSVLLTDAVFQRLREKFEKLTTKHGHLLVGVAKRSRVLSYLSVALGLSESFSNGEPAYLPVPAELEREAAPAQYRWIGSRAMGLLHVARLDRGEGVPLMPVDIAGVAGGARRRSHVAAGRLGAREFSPARLSAGAGSSARTRPHGRLGDRDAGILAAATGCRTRSCRGPDGAATETAGQATG